jgi:hypothetical protein
LPQPVADKPRDGLARVALGDAVDRQAEMIAVDMVKQLVARSL